MSQMYPKIIISTGNVITVNDLRKAGKKPTEELIDSLKVTLLDSEIVNQADETYTYVKRKNDDLLSKIKEHERLNIKIGAKLFLNNNCGENLIKAVNTIFETLDITYLDNLILAYHPCSPSTSGGLDNHIVQNGGGSETREGVMQWGSKDKENVDNLLKLWGILEQFAIQKKIGQLGIADLDVETLQRLYSESTIHPTITQINLATCCIVPPQLQDYCNAMDIQLLTHSDPQEIIDSATINELKSLGNHKQTWTTRYQVHIKCRGVLAAKGYLLCVEKQ